MKYHIEIWNSKKQSWEWYYSCITLYQCQCVLNEIKKYSNNIFRIIERIQLF